MDVRSSKKLLSIFFVIIVSIFVTLLTCIGATRLAFAADNPTIYFDGDSGLLELRNAPNDNLFQNFTSVMPGDNIDQDIALQMENIKGPVRVYVEAQTDEALTAALAEAELSATYPENPNGLTGSPDAVFKTKTLIYETDTSIDETLQLHLYIPTTVGDEVNGLSAPITWIITIEYEGDISTTGFQPFAQDLTAYEGGNGTDQTNGADGMPQPAWANISAETEVTVDGQLWDIAEQGMPFAWNYVNAATGEVVEDFALAGLYRLEIKPLDGNHRVYIDEKPLYLPADGVVKTEDGSDVITEVREVTDNNAAATNDESLFKGVFDSSKASSAATIFDSLTRQANADPLANDFNDNGAASGECDNSQPHAHVVSGTTFLRNGNADLPVNEGVQIGLLWDEFLPEVLGSPERMSVLDEKARAVAGNTFKASQGVETRFKYLDLVDMNDGNIWVSTADNSDVTVFIPYFDSLDSSDEIAVVGFDGLTRDYTIDMPSADLNAELAKTQAWAVSVEKTSDGIMFNVPAKQFGPFELLWVDNDGGSEGEGGNGDGDGDGNGDDVVVNNDENLSSHKDSLAKTSDMTTPIAIGAAAIALLALIMLLIARRRARG